MTNATLKIIAAAAALAAGVGIAQAQQGPGPNGEGPVFELLDADGNGEITAEDIAAKRTERFAMLDADGNGTVTKEEFIAHAQAEAGTRAEQMFARIDVDGDGTLSRDALESRFGGGPNPNLIARLDTDNSGGVSLEEFNAAKERMAMRGGFGKRGGDGHERGERMGRHGGEGHGEGGEGRGWRFMNR